MTKKNEGAILLSLLIAVAVIGLVAGMAGNTWKTIMQRANEEELLWRGNQYRMAISSYYSSRNSGTHGSFPTSLKHLIRDPRVPGNVRYLRKLYLDPMTGKEWVVVKGPDGQIQGVRSSSQLEPFKKDNFSEENKTFAGKMTYSEWMFVYKPKAPPRAIVPAKAGSSAK